VFALILCAALGQSSQPTLIDGQYGPIPLTPLPTVGPSSYIGVRQVQFPGSAVCPPGSVPLWYRVDIGPNVVNLSMGWTACGGACPCAGLTPATPIGVLGFCQSQPRSQSMNFSLNGGWGPHPIGTVASQTVTLP
jgi:hypothetical protein